MAEQDHSKTIGKDFDAVRDRLRRMVKVRMDPRLRGRIDASDVVQESYLEAVRRLPEYQAEKKMPFFLWVRFLTGQKLLELHRRHLGTQARDARRELPLEIGGAPEASSVCLAEALAVTGSFSPAKAAARKDQQALLEQALEKLEPGQREVLVLRHYEDLSNVEVARVLNLSEAGASLRHLKAVQRLSELLKQLRSESIS
jgi:RNA polymerase sigma-70 factor (ECF subfamily)